MSLTIISYVSWFCIESHCEIIFMYVKITKNQQKLIIFVNLYCFWKKKRRERERNQISQKITLLWWNRQISLARLWDINLLYFTIDLRFRLQNKDRKFPSKVHSTNEKCHLIEEDCFHAKTRHNFMEDLFVSLVKPRIKPKKHAIFMQRAENRVKKIEETQKAWLSFHALDYLASADLIFKLKERKEVEKMREATDGWKKCRLNCLTKEKRCNEALAF